MELDLTKEQDRMQAIRNINDSFIAELTNNGIELSKDAKCYVNRNVVNLGITSLEDSTRMDFASEVEIYTINSINPSIADKNEINMCASGSFDPTQREGYWRTIHAASILKNWDIVCSIANKHSEMYSQLGIDIHKANKR